MLIMVYQKVLLSCV